MKDGEAALNIHEQYNIGKDIISIGRDQIIYHNSDKKNTLFTGDGIKYINMKDSSPDEFLTNPSLKTVKRTDDMNWLKKFIETGDNLKIGAVCGYGGIGKTKLMIDFIELYDWKEWNVLATNWSDLKDNGIEESQISHNTFLILDDVLAYADEIGNWIKKLYHNMNYQKTEFHVRIIILERTPFKQDYVPYWYSEIICQNNLQNICQETDVLHLKNFSDNDLLDIASQYVRLKNDNDQSDLENFIENMSKYIKETNDRCKTPLYVLYAADAWVNKKEIKQWMHQPVKSYICEKIKKRIFSVFPKKHTHGECLENILVFIMAISGMELKNELPMYLKEDYEKIKKKAKKRGSNIKEIFVELEVKFKEEPDKIYVEYELPEVVKEIYCLEYLEKLRFDRDEEEKFQDFMREAWSLKPRKFMEFLCRTAEDFYDHEFVHIKGIFQRPKDLKLSNYKYYLEALREMTYWKREFEDDIINNFDTMYSEIIKSPADAVDAQKIAELYAISLFNLIWHWEQEKSVSAEKRRSAQNQYLEKIEILCSRYPDSCIIKRSQKWSEETLLITNDEYVQDNVYL